MKYLYFSDEVLRVPSSVTFWILERGKDYQAAYCVNMSELDKQNFLGEPAMDSIIRSEGYKTLKEAKKRLLEILEILNDE